MLKNPKISESEWAVMKVLWNAAPLTSAEVVEALEAETNWKPNTIKTLLARLTKKGAVKADKRKRDHLYFPAVTEEQCVRAESKSFRSRVYSGSLVPMIAGFLKEEKLTPEEIAKLRQLLDEMDNG